MCVFYISVWEKSTETTIGGTLHTFRVFTSLPISDVNSLLHFSTFFFYFILSLQSVSSLIPIIRHTKQEENTRNWVSVEKLIEQPLLCFACFVCGSPDARMNKLNRENEFIVSGSSSRALTRACRHYVSWKSVSNLSCPYQSQMFSQSCGNVELIVKNGKHTHTHTQFPSLLFLIFSAVLRVSPSASPIMHLMSIQQFVCSHSVFVLQSNRDVIWKDFVPWIVLKWNAREQLEQLMRERRKTRLE